MNRKLCLLFLLGLVVALVKSETTIEVDENGDEYEVKKFNIQGRQLNGGRSQCVVTRRKRATPQPMAMYNMAADEGSNDEVDDKTDGDTMLGIEQQSVLFYSPPTVNPTADVEAEGEEEEEETGALNNVTVHVVPNENKKESTNKGENEDYNEEDDDSETIEVVQLPQLPILGQLQSDGESVAAIASAGNAGQVGNINTINRNGIMVVQSHTPPKVNPLTHAVFELVPVNQSGAAVDEDEEDEDEDNGDDNDEDDFYLDEDISPMTTTAIWSTGDDNTNDLKDYDDLDKQPIKTSKLTKIAKKPVKMQRKKKKKSSLKPKRKNQSQKKYSNKRRVTSSGNKRRRVTKRPTKTTVRRPIRRRKLRRGYNTRSRPQPIKRQQHNKNDNNNSRNTLKKRKNAGSNNNNKFVAKKHKNKKHAEIIDQGTNTFTRTMTMTQTGDEDDDKNVNCIFIRKDPPPPTTTPRPFWNILGRNANGAPIASGHYGQRKRVNVRFVA